MKFICNFLKVSAVRERVYVDWLTKSLYGLKKASRQWNYKLTEALTKLQFNQTFSVFTRKQLNIWSMYLWYVDDMLISGSSLELIEQTKLSLQQVFKMKDLGELKYLLGIEFTTSKKMGLSCIREIMHLS